MSLSCWNIWMHAFSRFFEFNMFAMLDAVIRLFLSLRYISDDWDIVKNSNSLQKKIIDFLTCS